MLDRTLSKMPDIKSALVVLSGGMDSAVTLRLAIKKYSKENVKAIIFKYGQRQEIEVAYAMRVCEKFGVEYKLCDVSAIADIAQGFSANTDKTMQMPGAAVKGQRATTYVPNRNMVLLSLAAAYAEVKGCDGIFFGSQASDTSHDNNIVFMDKMNAVFAQNQKFPIQVYAPLHYRTKADEISMIIEMDGSIEFFRDTMTCYNPNEIFSCGKCSACLGRLSAFEQVGYLDPIPYVSITGS